MMIRHNVSSHLSFPFYLSFIHQIILMFCTNSCFSFSFLSTARWNYLTLSYLRLAPQSYYLCSFYTSFHVACASVICVLKYLPTYLIIHSPFTVPVISSFSVDLRLSSSTTPESSVPDNLSLPAYIRLQRNR